MELPLSNSQYKKKFITFGKLKKKVSNTPFRSEQIKYGLPSIHRYKNRNRERSFAFFPQNIHECWLFHIFHKCQSRFKCFIFSCSNSVPSFF